MLFKRYVLNYKYTLKFDPLLSQVGYYLDSILSRTDDRIQNVKKRKLDEDLSTEVSLIISESEKETEINRLLEEADDINIEPLNEESLQSVSFSSQVCFWF